MYNGCHCSSLNCLCNWLHGLNTQHSRHGNGLQKQTGWDATSHRNDGITLTDTGTVGKHWTKKVHKDSQKYRRQRSHTSSCKAVYSMRRCDSLQLSSSLKLLSCFNLTHIINELLVTLPDWYCSHRTPKLHGASKCPLCYIHTYSSSVCKKTIIIFWYRNHSLSFSIICKSFLLQICHGYCNIPLQCTY